VLFVAAAAQHAQRTVLTLEEEEQQEARDESLGTMLDKLGGAIQGTSLNIMPTEVSSSKPALALHTAGCTASQK
jgi:hypothetical protein